MEPWAWEYVDPDHPRPADVAVVERFLNTVDRHTFGAHAAKPDDRRDRLRSAAALREWLRESSLLERGRTVEHEDVELARRLRDGVREWLAARQGLEHDTAAVERADEVLESVVLRASLRGDRIALVATAARRGAVLAPLVRYLVSAHESRTLDRLRICAAADCRFVFYDHSRSRSSRWCSMATCGNRVKTRRYRARRAAASDDGARRRA